MPDAEKDKLADALRAMSGEDATTESDLIDESLSIDTPRLRPSNPTERRARPERPVRPPAPGAKPVEIVPAQAPKPSLRPTDPSAAVTLEAKERPTEPPLVESPEPIQSSNVPPPASVAPTVDAGLSETSGLERIVDDDLVAVPAPSAEILMSAGRRYATPTTPRAPKRRSLGFQRTLIPILLTLAFLLPAMGMWLAWHPEESELRLYGQRLFIYLLGGGVVFLILAIVNMIQVRDSLKAG